MALTRVLTDRGWAGEAGLEAGARFSGMGSGMGDALPCCEDVMFLDGAPAEDCMPCTTVNLDNLKDYLEREGVTVITTPTATQPPPRNMADKTQQPKPSWIKGVKNETVVTYGLVALALVLFMRNR